MAKYPVELGDDPGQLDAINYLLSGNQSLGQSVQGFVSSTTAYQTGNNVLPFTGGTGELYRIETISTATWLDSNTIQFNYPSTLSNPAFALGNTLTVTGCTPSQYNLTYDSVVKSTTTYVVVRTASTVPNMGAGSGGSIKQNAGATNVFKYLHTDCLAVANVLGGTDFPVISAQIKNTIQYYNLNPSSLLYTAAINRYKLFPNGTFTFDKTVAYQAYTASLPTTTNSCLSLTITSGTKALTTYPNTYALTLNAAGYDLKVNITINASISASYNSTNTTITITNGGYGWTVGDTITISGTDLGAATPTNDLVLTVASIGSFSGNDTLTYSTIFTAVKDAPVPGSYIYFLDTSYYQSTGDTYVLSASLDYRSLTATVLKE